MGFLDWLRAKTKKNREAREARRDEIDRALAEITLAMRSANLPRMDWETKMNPEDAEALTGKPHEIHSFFRHPTTYGSIRIHVDHWHTLNPSGTSIYEG